MALEDYFKGMTLVKSGFSHKNTQRPIKDGPPRHMNTLITYYSFEGNCRALAKHMVETAPATANAKLAELLPVLEPVPRTTFGKYVVGGKVALLKHTTPLQPLGFSLRNFDLIIVGGPVWFFDITPAVRTFLTQTNWHNKYVALFTMHRGGRGKALATMRSLVEKRGGVIASTAEFTDLRRGSPMDTRDKATAWIKSLAGEVS
jgi:flavodoxin